jgi:thymidylate synthase (FAD)
MATKLISVTPDAEKLMAYCARVSNPKNQENDNYAKLLKYCIDHQHWSIFEHGFMTLEINTNRGIAAQILRHRSFTFQEFSQRYADTSLLSEDIQVPQLRSQDNKNRQNSIDDLPQEKINQWNCAIREHFAHAKALYDGMLKDGIAKECARFVLPLSTPTRIYMSGNCRNWIHYIQLRSANGTQKEHMSIANECKDIFMKQFPIVSEALGWMNV